MAVNDKGELTSSIPSICSMYEPNGVLSKVVCSKLGLLEECKNHKGEKSGWLFCENTKAWKK